MSQEFYKLPMQQYLDIQALSQGVLQCVIDECAQAAWWQSYLNPKRPREISTEEQDLGTIAHSALLEGNTDMCTVLALEDFPNADGKGHATSLNSNKAIKTARDALRAGGKIPVLDVTLTRVNAMVDSAWSFIDSLRSTEPAVYDAFRGNGKSEVTITWDDDFGVPCKARFDRVNAGRTIVVDAKFSSMSVEPNRWARSQMVSFGYYFGAGFYRRGIAKVYNVVDAEYLFLNINTDPPHLVSLCGLDPEAKALGDAKVLYALRTWTDCARKGHFPAYPNRVVYPELPPWEALRFEELQAERPMLPYAP